MNLSPLPVSQKVAARDPMEEIKRAFALFADNKGEDGNARIGLRDLKRVAKELGENLDDDEL